MAVAVLGVGPVRAACTVRAAAAPLAVAVVISMGIALGTVLWQTLKAARTNPATELKKE